jgi:hypothetical protein
MLVYPNHSVYFDEQGIAIRMSVYDDVLNLDINRERATFIFRNVAFLLSFSLELCLLHHLSLET